MSAMPGPGMSSMPTPLPVTTFMTPTGGAPTGFEESYIENILRLNLGKIGTFYMTYENNSQWNAKIFKGVVEAAGRDHIIISDPVTGVRTMMLMVNFDFATFDQPLNYAYPGVAGTMQPGMTPGTTPGTPSTLPSTPPSVQGIQTMPQNMQPSVQGIQSMQQNMQPSVQGIQSMQQNMPPSVQGIQSMQPNMKPGVQGIQSMQQNMPPSVQGIQSMEQKKQSR